MNKLTIGEIIDFIDSAKVFAVYTKDFETEITDTRKFFGHNLEANNWQIQEISCDAEAIKVAVFVDYDSLIKEGII